MSTTGWWVLGWIVGVGVVALVAALLLWIIALARRVARQAEDIVAALDGTRDNTAALYDVVVVNHAIDRVARGLRAVRHGMAR